MSPAAENLFGPLLGLNAAGLTVIVSGVGLGRALLLNNPEHDLCCSPQTLSFPQTLCSRSPERPTASVGVPLKLPGLPYLDRFH